MAYLFATFFGTGILFGNLNALAIDSLGKIAGIGSGVVGSLSTFIALITGTAIGQSYNGTVLPLTAGFFIENSRKPSPFRAGMDSVATASGLFVRPACARSLRWKSYRELTTTLPPVDYPQYRDNASSESFCLIPLLAIH